MFGVLDGCGKGLAMLGDVLVCQCEVINDRRIRAEIADGARCADDVALRCGAGARCGGCRPTIEALLATLGPVEQPVAVGV